MQFEVFARTEVGCARERNEDAFLVFDLGSGEQSLQRGARPMSPPGTVVAVCDGMGGAAAGHVASKLALDGLVTTMRGYSELRDVVEVEKALLQAVTAANQRIANYIKRHPQNRGMGTTMTAAAMFGPDVVIVQVGDSRAYIRRGPLLQQLTMDQNVVGHMIANGQIRPDQAKQVRARNMLLQAIGVQERVGPDLVRVRVQPGDVLLLCSDGLTGPLEDREVLDLLMRHDDPARGCRALTEAACAAGGPDNVTVAVMRVFDHTNRGVNATAPVQFQRRAAVA